MTELWPILPDHRDRPGAPYQLWTIKSANTPKYCDRIGQVSKQMAVDDCTSHAKLVLCPLKYIPRDRLALILIAKKEEQFKFDYKRT